MSNGLYQHQLKKLNNITKLAPNDNYERLWIFSEPQGIACFKCVSHKGNNPACEDPFHNNYTVDMLHTPCYGGRKGRNGLFPATACIKVAGKFCEYSTIRYYLATCFNNTVT